MEEVICSNYIKNQGVSKGQESTIFKTDNITTVSLESQFDRKIERIL